MNVDFADSQLTQRVSKLSSILIKKESNGKIAKKATDKQIRIHTMIMLKAGHVSWKQQISLLQCSFTCLIFFSCLLLYMQHLLFMGQFYVLGETNFK